MQFTINRRKENNLLVITKLIYISYFKTCLNSAKNIKFYKITRLNKRRKVNEQIQLIENIFNNINQRRKSYLVIMRGWINYGVKENIEEYYRCKK